MGMIGRHQPLLKAQVKGLAATAIITKQEEHKKLRWARLLNGYQSFKHQKGEPKPEARPPFELKNRERDQEEEKQTAYEDFWGLHRFRTTELRKAARHHQLAYAFLRGKSYQVTEEHVYLRTLPDFDEVLDIAKLYAGVTDKEEGDNEFKAAWEEWIMKAQAFIEIVIKIDEKRKKVQEEIASRRAG